MKNFKMLLVLFVSLTYWTNAQAVEAHAAPEVEVEVQKSTQAELRGFNYREAVAAYKLAVSSNLNPHVATNKTQVFHRSVVRLGPEFLVFQAVNFTIAQAQLWSDAATNPASLEQLVESYDHPMTYFSFLIFKGADEVSKYGANNLNNMYVNYLLKRDPTLNKAQKIANFQAKLPYLGMGLGLFASSVAHDIGADKDLLDCAKNFFRTQPGSLEKDPCTKAWHNWITERKFENYESAFASMMTSTYLTMKIQAGVGQAMRSDYTQNKIKSYQEAKQKKLANRPPKTKLIVKGIDIVFKKLPSGKVTAGASWVFNKVGSGSKQFAVMFSMFLPMVYIDHMILPFFESPINAFNLAEKINDSKDLMHKTIEASVKRDWAPINSKEKCDTILIANCIPEAFHAIKYWSDKSREWRDFLYLPIKTSYEAWMQKLTSLIQVHDITFNVITKYLELRKSEQAMKSKGLPTIMFDPHFVNGLSFKAEKKSSKEPSDEQAAMQDMMASPPQDPLNFILGKVLETQKIIPDLVSLSNRRNGKDKQALQQIINQLKLPDGIENEENPDLKFLTNFKSGVSNYRKALLGTYCQNCSEQEVKNIAQDLAYISRTYHFFPNPKENIGLGFRDYLLSLNEFSEYLSADQVNPLMAKGSDVKNIDFIFYYFLCGTTAGKIKNNLIKNPSGYKAEFNIPKIVTNKYDISEYCKEADVMELSKRESINVFTTVINAKYLDTKTNVVKVKKYSGLMEFLNENIRPEFIHSDNIIPYRQGYVGDGGQITFFDKWWKHMVEPQMNAAFVDFNVSYSEIVKKMASLFSNGATTKKEKTLQWLKDAGKNASYKVYGGDSSDLPTDFYSSANEQIDNLWEILLTLLPEGYKKDPKFVKTLNLHKNYINENIIYLVNDITRIDAHFKDKSKPLPSKKRIQFQLETCGNYFKDTTSSLIGLMKDEPELKQKAVKEIFAAITSVHENLATLLQIANATDFQSTIDKKTSEIEKIADDFYVPED